MKLYLSGMSLVTEKGDVIENVYVNEVKRELGQFQLRTHIHADVEMLPIKKNRTRAAKLPPKVWTCNYITTGRNQPHSGTIDVEAVNDFTARACAILTLKTMERYKGFEFTITSANEKDEN